MYLAYSGYLTVRRMLLMLTYGIQGECTLGSPFHPHRAIAIAASCTNHPAPSTCPMPWAVSRTLHTLSHLILATALGAIINSFYK